MPGPPAEPTAPASTLPATPRPPRPKREWKPPVGECLYLRLADFPNLFQISMSTAHRLAVKGKLPFIRVPGTHNMLFPRAKVEAIIRSWGNGGKR